MARFSASNYNLGSALGNVNADNGWGPYKWPGGVPENLLANFSYQQVNGERQLIRGRVRRELAGLFTLAAAIADVKFGYQIWSFNGGVNWGPWTYENRAISGTNSASNHSRARAWDINAPYNGYANGFAAISSDIPPAMVSDYESIGLSWGGRYGDAMHFEYARSPGDVAADEARARSILGGSAIGNAPDKPSPAAPAEPDEIADTIEDEGDDDMLSVIVAADGPSKGTFFAVGPNHWHGLADIEAYNEGRAAGLFREVKTVANQRALDVARTVALQLVEGENVITIAK